MTSNDSPQNEYDPNREEINFTIDRELYEELRDNPYVIKENYRGQRIHISEDFQTVGPEKYSDDLDAWGPVFDTGSKLTEDETECDHAAKTVLLEGSPGDTVEIREVITGMRRVPEKLEIKRRVNTYFGPQLSLQAPEEFPGDIHGWELTCPGPDSWPILWKAVSDHENYRHGRVKVAKVKIEIFNVAGYDICAVCEEPIMDPMHRSLAMVGQCPGGMNDDE